jgi:hypothetical protein
MEEQPQVQEDKVFDLRVHVREPKTGKLIEVKPYRLHCIRGGKWFERPAGSFKFYTEGGDEVPVNTLPPELLVGNPNAPKPIQEKAAHVVKAQAKTPLELAEE